jgi:nicotinamidase-related amidase
LLICIDIQKDFMDNGALGVPGANEDVIRLTQFIYRNMDNITSIAASIDTHIPHQIFHPCWWIDDQGQHPKPYTLITFQDVKDGKWKPVIQPKDSREYVEGLERNGRKVLCIWPYHCIQGTTGCSLENQFSNMLYFHSVAKKSVPQRLVKGFDPLSEMYGIIKPEFDTKNYINKDFLNDLEKYDKIIISGEAKSHSVGESIQQILEYYQGRTDVTQKIYLLEDCMSSIPGFESVSDTMFKQFKEQYGVNVITANDKIF